MTACRRTLSCACIPVNTLLQSMIPLHTRPECYCVSTHHHTQEVQSKSCPLLTFDFIRVSPLPQWCHATLHHYLVSPLGEILLVYILLGTNGLTFGILGNKLISFLAEKDEPIDTTLIPYVSTEF